MSSDAAARRCHYISGLHATNERLQCSLDSRVIRKIFAKAASTAGLVDVRLHDLRRTVMTRAAMAGVGTHVLRDLLGHRTTAMADRYIRSVGNPVRDARELVGAMAAMMQGKPGSEVVQTPRGQRHAPETP